MCEKVADKLEREKEREIQGYISYVRANRRKREDPFSFQRARRHMFPLSCRQLPLRKPPGPGNFSRMGLGKDKAEKRSPTSSFVPCITCTVVPTRPNHPCPCSEGDYSPSCLAQLARTGRVFRMSVSSCRRGVLNHSLPTRLLSHAFSLCFATCSPAQTLHVWVRMAPGRPQPSQPWPACSPRCPSSRLKRERSV